MSQRFLVSSVTSKRLHNYQGIIGSSEWSLGRIDWTCLQQIVKAWEYFSNCGSLLSLKSLKMEMFMFSAGWSQDPVNTSSGTALSVPLLWALFSPSHWIPCLCTSLRWRWPQIPQAANTDVENQNTPVLVSEEREFSSCFFRGIPDVVIG